MAANDSTMPSAPKRGRPENDPESEFESLISGLQQEVVGYVDKNLKSTAYHLASQFQGVIAAHDRKCEKRFSNIENAIEKSGANQFKLENQMAALKEDLTKVQQQLHLQENAASLTSTPPSSGRPFDDPIDTTILRIDTFHKELIAKTTLQAFLSTLFETSNVDSDKYEVNGDDADFRHTIKFKGACGLVARNAEHAQRSLRDSCGKCKELKIGKPAGGDTRLFINPDRTPQMQKLIRESKKLGEIFKEAHPGVKWHINRNDGEISKGWTPIVKIDVQEGDIPSRLLWNLDALSDTSINREDILSRFASSRQRQPVTWSI